MKRIKFLSLLVTSLLLASCSNDNENVKDEIKPTININYNGGFPQACEVLSKGVTYTFKAKVTDNESLASYSIDLHHNFDHHTHDDQEATCNLELVKDAVNPLIYMENFSIKDNLKEYEISIPIAIPENTDSGDYHCSFSVTDATGWQSRTSIDIKIIE